MYVLRSILHILRVHVWCNLALNSLSNIVAAGAESNQASPRRERVCASVCVFVCERERESEWEWERESEREREREVDNKELELTFCLKTKKELFLQKISDQILFFWKLQQRPSLSPTAQQNDSRKKRPVTDFILEHKISPYKEVSQQPWKAQALSFPHV